MKYLSKVLTIFKYYYFTSNVNDGPSVKHYKSCSLTVFGIVVFYHYYLTSNFMCTVLCIFLYKLMSNKPSSVLVLG